MFTLGQKWHPIDPQCDYLAREVFSGDTLVARIVDTTAQIYLRSSSGIRLYEIDLFLGEVWETGDDKFSDEASALRSIQKRLAEKNIKTLSE